MESSTKRGMKIEAEIAGAESTSTAVWKENGTITMVVVAGVINITEAWGFTGISYLTKK